MDVRVNATGTICNFVLEFSPMKKVIVENGIIDKLVYLSQSDVSELRFKHDVLNCFSVLTLTYLVRLNSIWALKNMAFLASAAIKTTVIEQFTPQR